MCMTLAQNLNSHKLYVGFLLINDSSYNSQKKEIERHLQKHEDVFSFLVDHENPSVEMERSIVYCLTPIPLRTVKGKEKILAALKDIFDETRRFLPTFTQGTHDEDDR